MKTKLRPKKIHLDLSVEPETRERWKEMKRECSIKSNDTFTKILLDILAERRKEKKISLLGNNESNSSMAYSYLNQLKPYHNCSINGLPVLKCFRATVDGPDNAPLPHERVFMLLPYEARLCLTEVLDVIDKNDGQFNFTGVDPASEEQAPEEIIVVKQEQLNDEIGSDGSDCGNSDDLITPKLEETYVDDYGNEPTVELELCHDIQMPQTDEPTAEFEFSPDIKMPQTDEPTDVSPKSADVPHRTKLRKRKRPLYEEERYDSDTEVEDCADNDNTAIDNGNDDDFQSETENKPSVNNNGSCDPDYIPADCHLDAPVKKADKYQRKRTKPRKKVQKQPWISISLNGHEDKYTIDTFSSLEQKNRNKKDEVIEKLYSCLVCKNFKAEGRDYFERHLEEHVNGRLRCKQCGFEANSLQFLNKQHAQECEAGDMTGGKYICDLCGVVSLNGTAHKVHMGIIHKQMHYKCRYCDEMLASGVRRKFHEKKSHAVEAKYCQKCEKYQASLSASEYEEHVASCPDTTPCPICGKLFTSRRGLSDHVHCTHAKMRAHQCHLCSYSAKTRRHLVRHLQVHNGIHPFQCKQCTFTCVQPYQLKSHMRTHTGEKPFKCDQCNYAAAWNVQLKEHKKVHGLNTALTCQQCGIVFKNRTSLSMHERKDHS